MKTLRYKNCILFCTFVLFFLLFATAFSLYATHSRLAVRDELIARAESSPERCFSDSFIIRSDGLNHAERIAAICNGELRLAQSRNFATVFLRHGTFSQALAQAELLPYVQYLLPDEAVAQQNIVPRNEDYNKRDPLYDMQEYLAVCGLNDCWTETRGKGVTVAVIDSGIDTDHPDFVRSDGSSILSPMSYNATTQEKVSDCGVAVLDDTNRFDPSDPEYEARYETHGTEVSGLIAALHNGEGINGVAPEADFLFIRCSTTNGAFRASDLQEALEYAIAAGANVINMSYSTSAIATSPLQSAVIKQAHEQGIVLVASAGNDSSIFTAYPAGQADVIGVGAVTSDSDPTLTTYTNYGKNTCDIYAPGNVLTTINGSWGEVSGTSFSAPIVSGIVALYLSAHGIPKNGEEVDHLRNVLHAACTDLGEPGYDTIYCYGLIHADRFVLGRTGTLTFDLGNGESFTSPCIMGYVYPCAPTPLSDEYIFQGWYYDSACTDPVNWEEDVFTSPEVRLYADWTTLENASPSTLFSYEKTVSGTWEITGVKYSAKTCVVPSYIDGIAVTSIGSRAFFEMPFESIVLPETLTNIGSYALYGTAIQKLVIPDKVTVIRNYAVANCLALEELTIGKGLVTIGDFAFSRCRNLDKLYYNAECVVTLSGTDNLFDYTGNKGATSVNNTGFDLILGDSVRAIPARLFYSANAETGASPRIRSVTASEHAKLASIGEYAFAECASLQKVSLPRLAVALGKYAFSGCVKAEFDRATVVSDLGIGAFANCASLRYVTLTGDATRVRKDAFIGCTALEQCVLAADATGIGAGAFSGCSALHTLVIPSSCKNIDSSAFTGCSLLDVYLDLRPDELTEQKRADLAEQVRSLHFAGEWKVFSAYDGAYALAVIPFSESLTLDLPELTHENDVAYSYTFLGWDTDGDGATDTLPEVVTESLTATAVFEAERNLYTLTFYDTDGTVYIRTEGYYGDVVIVPSVPVREGFTSGYWQGYSIGMTVTGDLSFHLVLQANETSDTASDSAMDTPIALRNVLLTACSVAAVCIFLLVVLIIRKFRNDKPE